MKLLISIIGLAILTGCALPPSQHQIWYDNAIKESRARLEAELEEAKRLEASCAPYSGQSRSVITAQEASVVEEKVKYQLKDPWSARFRNVARASLYTECRYGTQYTGEVNAKNSMGGYTGFRWFTVGKGGVEL